MCDIRCKSGLGKTCNCSCGGTNHGVIPKMESDVKTWKKEGKSPTDIRDKLGDKYRQAGLDLNKLRNKEVSYLEKKAKSKKGLTDEELERVNFLSNRTIIRGNNLKIARGDRFDKFDKKKEGLFGHTERENIQNMRKNGASEEQIRRALKKPNYYDTRFRGFEGNPAQEGMKRQKVNGKVIDY